MNPLRGWQFRGASWYSRYVPNYGTTEVRRLADGTWLRIVWPGAPECRDHGVLRGIFSTRDEAMQEADMFAELEDVA